MRSNFTPILRLEDGFRLTKSGVAVEKVFCAKIAKIKLRQDAL